MSAPALLLSALAVGALRGFLDTTTPLAVGMLTLLIDYSIQPQWFAFLLPASCTFPQHTRVFFLFFSRFDTTAAAHPHQRRRRQRW